MEKIDHKTTLEALRKSDRQVFDALFRAYYEPLCNYACSMLKGDMDTAEDIVQDRFFKLWEKRESLEINYSIKSYLYKMVYNACLNRIRSEKVQNQYKQYNVTYIEANPVMAIDTTFDMQENIKKAIAELPKQCRVVFELNRFEELKYREIAEQLDISIKTVENQMGKALRVLREKLVDYITILIMFLFLKF